MIDVFGAVLEFLFTLAAEVVAGHCSGRPPRDRKPPEPTKPVDPVSTLPPSGVWDRELDG